MGMVSYSYTTDATLPSPHSLSVEYASYIPHPYSLQKMRHLWYNKQRDIVETLCDMIAVSNKYASILDREA